MVYLGPSKGCLTCRHRRKKCDEGRPSCQRCIKSRRTCRGYEDNNTSAFRSYLHEPTCSAPPHARDRVSTATKPTSPQWTDYTTTFSLHPQNPHQQSQHDSQLFVSEARRCTLPVRAIAPGDHELPEDFRPVEVTESERLQFALRGFFYDCCVLTTNQNLSRGFLNNVELMTRQLGLESYLVKACEAVAFVTHGKTLNRPNLTKRAETRYQDLLGELAQLIDIPGTRDPREKWLVAMLLGLYQIIHASEEDRGNHSAHSRGLAALLGITHSPLSLLYQQPQNHANGAWSHLHAHPHLGETPQPPRPFFRAPSTDPTSCETLDSLILAAHALWSGFQTCTRLEDFHSIRRNAILLDERFQHWQRTRTPEFTPVVSGYVPDFGPERGYIPRRGSAGGSPGSSFGLGREGGRSLEVVECPPVGYWPGRVDSYFDHSVVGVWNIFRATRLFVLYLIVTLDTPMPYTPVSMGMSSSSPSASISTTSPYTTNNNDRNTTTTTARSPACSWGGTPSSSGGGADFSASSTTEGGSSAIDYTIIAQQVILDMFASIPYSLTDKLPDFLIAANCTSKNTHKATNNPGMASPPSSSPYASVLAGQEGTIDPRKPMDGGRLSGGLLLMHPLHVAMNMPFATEEMRAYMRKTLEWIGTKGGIGMGLMMAKADDILDMDYLTSSCLIIWAGFLG